VPIATIVQTASQAITAVATVIGVFLALCSQPHAWRRRADPTGVEVNQARRQETVSAGSAPAKAKPEQAKLAEAQCLIDSGHHCAAILILKIALEWALQEAVQRSNIRTSRASRSIINMTKVLFNANVLNKSDVAAARHFSEIYHQAIAQFAEPSASQAHMAAEITRQIVQSIAK
jgi:hypothetical protein